jgi:hypothetical protein
MKRSVVTDLETRPLPRLRRRNEPLHVRILASLHLGEKISVIAEAKGRKSGWFKFSLAVLWFAGEFGGFIFGLIFMPALSGVSDAAALQAYPFALFGGACGAGLALLLASDLSPGSHRYSDYHYDNDAFAKPLHRRRDDDEDLMGPFGDCSRDADDTEEPPRRRPPPDDRFRE